MKWFSVVVVLLMLVAGARAEGPDDQYVAIYNTIQQADSLNTGAEYDRALEKYREAQTALLQLQKGYPDWSADVVKFRLKYLAGAIATLEAKVPPPAAISPSTPGQKQATAPSAAAPPPGKPVPSPELENQLNALNGQVRQLQDDNASLQAKLKEALAAQPGVLDPRQLARADEQIRALLKENALLQVSMEQQKAKPAHAADTKSLEQARQALERTNHDLAEQTRKANTLEHDKAALELKLKNLTPSSYNADAIKSTRKELQSANRKLAEQTKLAAQLGHEKDDMQSRINALKEDSEAAKALHAENKILKKQLAERQAAPSSTSAPATAKEDRSAQSARAQAQIASLEKTKEALHRENEALTEQLKKQALLAVAATNAPQSAKAQETKRVKKLEQERDALKQQLEASKRELNSARSAATTNAPQVAKAQDTKRVKKLEQERDALKQQLEASKKELNSARSAVTTNAPQVAEAQETKRVKKLEQERDALKQQLDASKKELNSARSAATTNAPQVAKAQETKRVKKLEQERDALKQQLEASKKELNSARSAATTNAPQVAKAQEAKRVKKLEQERDDLRKKLDVATKELSGRKGKTTPARTLEAEKQLASMRAKLDALQASPVPYTPEEAALFRRPETKPVEIVSKPARKASKELPPDSVALYAEAKRYYSAKQLDKAEDRYLQVLREDQNHVPTLANLAAVELELNHLPQAETNILQALELAPDDPACLAILGNLRFRQAKYDAAFDALSRAAEADPRNAEVQNYLGLTLSAKGLRGPAETALRKAIQLEPRYGDAHNNLAVIYATQKPPLLELARWHYQRALEAGTKPNPELEKLLEPAKAAEAGK